MWLHLKLQKKLYRLRKFLQNLEVVPVVTTPLKLFCDNGGAVAQSKEVSSYKGIV